MVENYRRKRSTFLGPSPVGHWAMTAFLGPSPVGLWTTTANSGYRMGIIIFTTSDRNQIPEGNYRCKSLDF